MNRVINILFQIIQLIIIVHVFNTLHYSHDRFQFGLVFILGCIYVCIAIYYYFVLLVKKKIISIEKLISIFIFEVLIYLIAGVIEFANMEPFFIGN